MTLGLAVACVAVQLATGAGPDRSQLLSDRLADAHAYLARHPYLAPGPGLAPHVDAAALRKQDDARMTERRQRGLPPLPAAVRSEEQARLDALVKEAYAALPASAAGRWGVRGRGGEPLAFAAHPLFHTGWLHLALGAICLLLLGIPVERRVGSAGIALLLPLSAIGVGAAHALTHADAPEAFVGLLGVAAGLGAACCGLSVRRGDPAALSAGVAGLGLVAGSFVLAPEWSLVGSGDAMPGASSTTASAAWGALGGMAVGGLFAGIALVSAGTALAGRRGGRAGETQGDQVAAHALSLRSRGRREDAYTRLASFLQEEPDHLGSLLAMWDVASETGREREAANALLRAVRLEIRQGALDAAAAHWLLLCEHEEDPGAEPALLIRLAQILAERGDRGPAARALRGALRGCDETSTAAVASRVARAAGDLDPALAREAVWRALGCADVELQERQQLEALLGTLDPVAADAHEAASPDPLAGARRESSGPEGSDTGAASSRPRAIDLDLHTREARIVTAVPLEVDGDALRIEAEGGSKKRVLFRRVEALAVAAVEGLGSKTVIVIDLVLNWQAPASEPLRVIRLRADRFDPRRFSPSSDSSLDAVRRFASGLLRRTQAVPLPDAQSVRGAPFAAFCDRATYERNVLGIQHEA